MPITFNLMVEHQRQQLDRIFHALSDPTRRSILRRLKHEELTVGELAHPYEISLAAVSKHLKTLEGARLIRRDTRGRAHYCRLNPRELARAQDWLSFYEQFWTERLDALDQVLTQDSEQES